MRIALVDDGLFIARLGLFSEVIGQGARRGFAAMPGKGRPEGEGALG